MVLMAASRCPLAAATLCALLLVVGCVGSENSGPALSSEPGPAVPQTVLVEAEPGAGTFVQPKDADRSDVESTAEVAALLLHSWDTLTDRTQTAAAVRARPLMIEEWAANQIEPERNGAHGDWLEPGQHRAFSSPSIVPVTGDVNRDVAADKVIRAYEVSWRWISHEGRDLGITGRQLVTLYLEQHDGLWDVVGHHFHELGTDSINPGRYPGASAIRSEEETYGHIF